MSIELVNPVVRASARARKQRFLDEAGHLLLVIRDGRVVAALDSGDLNALLHLAETAGTGYGADALAVVIEGVVPLVDVNPLTGQPWQRGEAEEVWQEHDGVAQGYVTETQICVIAARSGETADDVSSFRVADGVVEWDAVPLDGVRTGLGDALAARLRRPAVDAARVADPGGKLAGDQENGPFYDAEYGRIALDVGCTRILSNQLAEDGDVVYVVESAERAEFYVGEGLPQWLIEVDAPAASAG